MLRSAGIALSIGVIFLTFSGQSVRAGWSDLAASLTTGASSPVLSVKKNKNDDDDDDDNDHHGNDDHHNKKKKNTNDDTGLSECTIQGPSSGGGCKGGFKRVCEKLKSGKKCCGCVAGQKPGHWRWSVGAEWRRRESKQFVRRHNTRAEAGGFAFAAIL